MDPMFELAGLLLETMGPQWTALAMEEITPAQSQEPRFAPAMPAGRFPAGTPANVVPPDIRDPTKLTECREYCQDQLWRLIESNGEAGPLSRSLRKRRELAAKALYDDHEFYLNPPKIVLGMSRCYSESLANAEADRARPASMASPVRRSVSKPLVMRSVELVIAISRQGPQA
jgi:hypothetical protein